MHKHHRVVGPNSGDIRHEWPWENPVPGGVQLSKNVRIWIVNRNDITVTFECRKRIFTSNVANRHVKLESTKTEPLQPSSEFLGLRDKARWLLEGGLGLYLQCRWFYASPPHCNAECKKFLYSLSSFRTDVLLPIFPCFLCVVLFGLQYSYPASSHQLALASPYFIRFHPSCPFLCLPSQGCALLSQSPHRRPQLRNLEQPRRSAART